MPRNIEIKARIDSVETLLPRARALADRDAELIAQDDSFFAVPHGRLKLRQFADGSAELIHYHRPDSGEAKASDYVRVPVEDVLGEPGRGFRRFRAAREGPAHAGRGLLGDLRRLIEEALLKSPRSAFKSPRCR